jgi:adenylylsulfate kinase
MAPIQSAPRNTKKTEGFVVWFTGLPASGKTTLAATLALNLKERFPKVELLDADEAREHLGPAAGDSKAGPDAGERRLGFVAQRLSRSGVAAVVAAVSPARQLRADVRASVDRFVEVFCDAPLELAEKRDAKGIYARARKGELQNVAGVNGPYEPPEHAEVICRTAEQPIEECVLQVLKHLEQEGHISRRSSRAGPLVIRPLLPPPPFKHSGRVAPSAARAAAPKAGAPAPARPILLPSSKPIPIAHGAGQVKPAPARRAADASATPVAAGQGPARPPKEEPKAASERAPAKKAEVGQVVPRKAKKPAPKEPASNKPVLKESSTLKPAAEKPLPKKAAAKESEPKKAKPAAKKAAAKGGKKPAARKSAPKKAKPAAKKAAAMAGKKAAAQKSASKKAKPAAKKAAAKAGKKAASKKSGPKKAKLAAKKAAAKGGKKPPAAKVPKKKASKR